MKIYNGWDRGITANKKYIQAEKGERKVKAGEIYLSEIINEAVQWVMIPGSNSEFTILKEYRPFWNRFLDWINWRSK